MDDTFEDWLQSIHAKTYTGTDDDMPDAFDHWIENFDPMGLMEMAETFVKQKNNEFHYVIWSFEHNAWWKSGHRGYSESYAEAGSYSYQEALKICHGANFGGGRFVKNEAMVPIKKR